MDTESVETNAASDPSVSAQAGTFALLVAGETNSARPFLNTTAALARLMLSARSDFLDSLLACEACRWNGRLRVKPRTKGTTNPIAGDLEQQDRFGPL